ncbi:MAG: hypothetical protein JO166_10215, partial [Deltaproteobacteria bacterium]|nr:hypothetical protein [Deltaproteobacteria bacterium]
KNSLLTYNDLYDWKPDYIVLSSSMYDAPHFAELIKSQHYTMQNEGRYSVRLYQDLLPTERFGPTNVAGIDYIRNFIPSESCDDRYGHEYRPWLGTGVPAASAAAVLAVLGDNSVGRWISERVSGQLTLFNHAGRLLDAVRGRTCVSVGPSLRIYRVNASGTRDGFSTSFASASIAGLSPTAAFDGQPSYWMPPPSTALNSWLGFDFGNGGDREVRYVRIDWVTDVQRAGQVEIQYADFGGEWQSAGTFAVTTRPSGDSYSSRHELSGRLGTHRLWRVVFREVPPDGLIKVREVHFLESGSGS